MTDQADAVAFAVLKEFDRLPAKRKPQIRDNGTREWVPMSGIVAKHGDGSLTCLALATGMKCLPTAKVSAANGNILHDWHAEVFCIRAFNHFLLTECKAELTGTRSSSYVRQRISTDTKLTTRGHHHVQVPSFAWREDVTLHMYCSEAPCGDASMELTIAAQDDSAPWEAPLSRRMMERNGLSPNEDRTTSSTPDLLLLGRACFSHLGVVRRKPARPDAPPSLSKSCSDKLAARQCTSLLSSVAALHVAPENIYLTSLILPESQFSATAVERCFSPQGRMAGIKGPWDGGYVFRPFQVRTTRLEFGFSRRGIGKESIQYVASNLATAWTCTGLGENVVAGVLQGRKKTDPKAGCAVSRRNMWELAQDVARLADIDETVLRHESYAELKGTELLESRRQVKQDLRADALKGWLRNAGDEDFRLAG
ncbi:unnamed protein product [Discula destructiva]